MESATWSAEGDLDYLLKGARSGGAGYGVQTDIRCGSELLIYVRPKSTMAVSCCCHSSSVFATYRRGSRITVAPRALNQAVNGTQAFRVGSITSCSRAPAGTFAQTAATREWPCGTAGSDPPAGLRRRRASRTCAALHAKSTPNVKSCSSTNPPRDQQRMRRFTRSINQPRHLANGSPRSTSP